MIIYPQKPWADGQTFQHTASDGSVLTGVYDSGKNVWTFYRTNEDGSGAGALVTTADVKTLNVRPTTVKDPRDPTIVTTQQDANWWLLDNHVYKYGDTMFGTLDFKQPDIADPDGPLVELGSITPLANGEFSSLIINGENHLLLNSHKDIKLLAHSADSGYSGGFLEINETDLHATVYNFGQLAGEFQLKNTGAYLTGKNGVSIKGANTSANKLETSSGPVVTWGSSGISLNNKKVENVAEPTQDHHAATKGYVDAADSTKVSKDGDEVFGPLVISRPKNSDPNGQTYEIGSIDGDYDFHPDLQLNAEGSMTFRSTRGFDFYSKYPNQDGSAVFSFDDTGIRANIRDTDNQPSLEIALQDGISRIIAHKGLEIVGYDTGTNYLGYNQGEDRKAKTLSWSSAGIDLHDHKIANVAEPTEDKDAANKKYVDDKVESNTASLIEISDGTPGTPAVGKMWFDTSKSALYLRIS